MLGSSVINPRRPEPAPRLANRKRRVNSQVTTEGTRQEPSLKVNDLTPCRVLVEKFVTHGALLGLLIGDQEALPRFIGQSPAPRWVLSEIRFGNLAAVNEREHQPIDHWNPQLFHQIERQPEPAGAVFVQIADGRVQGRPRMLPQRSPA